MENNTAFASDVKEGLSSNPKKLSSKYFYDDEGSRIFQEIMKMPEYYLTNAEFEILSDQASDITDALDFGNEFSIIELGAGDGKKTSELLAYMVNAGLDVHYRPVDISSEAINLLETDLQNRLPKLKVESLVGDYFKVLGSLPNRSKPALFLFLGSNIGNYEFDEAEALMRKFNQFLQPGDKMLVGFDIIKNPRVIMRAYDDPHGITRRFNMNLLERMNRELNMDFDLDQFEFFPYYNPNNGELRSCLVSLKDQKVGDFNFEANELIHTELSKKYSIEDIRQIAKKSGYTLKQNFFDSRKLFADSLWEKG